MGALTLEARVENGLIKLVDPVSLPEQAKVYVVIPDLESSPPEHISSPRLKHPHQADDFIKEIVEVATDAGL
jgi:hypothetical protein